MRDQSWFLLADVGGTNARFAIADAATGNVTEEYHLSVADYPTFSSALAYVLEQVEQSPHWASLPSDGCLAVACPVEGDIVTFTNSAWVIDREDLQEQLSLPKLAVINDFEAQGHAAIALEAGDWVQLGEGFPKEGAPIAILGPGTGLGVCTVVPNDLGGYVVVPGQGGHVDFSPVDDLEIAILQTLMKRHPRVSAERLLSGIGLVNIHWALCQLKGVAQMEVTPAKLTEHALSGSDELARETVDVFFRVLGSVAGNLALTVGATGGVYIAGGIVPRLLEIARLGELRERFLAKGRLRDYLAPIPTRVMTRENAGLFGALQLIRNRTTT
ncbi:MAG: glucokinase [Pseudomonadota bacterium]